MSANNQKVGLLNGKNKLQAVTFGTKLEDLAKKIAEMDERDKKETMLDTRRNNVGWDTRKLYEVMLMEEIPEDKRPNAPTYAVLDSQLAKREEDDQDSTDNVRDQALLHYLANLANSNNEDDVFNFEFVGSLVQNGADINCMDTNGQTIFHEVARSWNVDVARFLVENGANVNHQDRFGRSPLHVAAAVDYASMVEFIVQNGGDIHIKTKGEEQTAIHYAAKNDAVNSLQMLLGHGAKIDSADCRNRTPLQVAAEMNSFKAAKLLVTEGAPAGVYDNLGNSALSLLIEKIPEVALIALDQFHTTDYINRREFYFLNYLEGAKLKEELQETQARSPLEIAVQNERFDVIMHPVMRRLIAVKWKIYGKRGAIMDMALNLIYTMLWTIIAVTTPRYGHDLYLPLEDNIWRFIIAGMIVLFTLMEIKRQVTKTVTARRELVKWREWRAEQLQQDKEYCHPRWRQEENYLNAEIDAVENLSLVSTSDWWMYFDWACLFLILAAIVTLIIFFVTDYDPKEASGTPNTTPTNSVNDVYPSVFWKELNVYVTIAMLIILWFRMFKYARPFENAGPHVVIFGKVVGDILKWIVLNAAIIIPFACAFWIAFGKNSDKPADGYKDVSSLAYNVFQMMIVGDYEWEELEKANVTMARILCGSFILIAAIITLNLLIALVTNTFERNYENAVANAVMQRARTILLLQSRMGNTKRKLYYDFIRSNASPQIIQNKYGRLMANKPEDRANIERVYDDVRQIKSVLAERFGKRFGKGKKSDLEIVREDLGKVKKSGKELANDIKNLKLILYGMGGQPVSPVRRSVESRNSSTELLKDRREQENASLNREGSKNDDNNDNNNNSKNNNDNNDSKNNNANNDSNNRKRHQGRRSSRKSETSCTESSESDDVFAPGSPPMPRHKQKWGRWKSIGENQKKNRGKHSRHKHDGYEKWWKGDYDQQSTSGRSRNDVPVRYFQPSSEPTYIEPPYSQSHIPIYPSQSNIRQASIPHVMYNTPVIPQYRSVTPIPQPRGYLANVLPTTMENFAHEYPTPSDDISLAFQPFRRISGASVGQQVTPVYTMMHVPEEIQQISGTDSYSGLRRRSALIHSGTISGMMPGQSLAQNEIYYEDETASSTRPVKPTPVIIQPPEQAVPVTSEIPGNTETTSTTQIQRTI